MLTHEKLLGRNFDVQDGMQVVLALRRRKGDKYQAFLYFRRGLAWPIRKVVAIMHHILTGQMLIGIEVAIEYMLGLTYSPQVTDSLSLKLAC